MVYVNFLGRSMIQVLNSPVIAIPISSTRTYIISPLVLIMSIFLFVLILFTIDHLSYANGVDSFVTINESDTRSYNKSELRHSPKYRNYK